MVLDLEPQVQCGIDLHILWGFIACHRDAIDMHADNREDVVFPEGVDDAEVGLAMCPFIG
jgi:hypothetical protein